MKEKICQLGLGKIPGIGHKSIKLLVAYCGGAEAVYRASRRELLKIPNIGPEAVAKIRRGTGLGQAEEELAILEKMKVEALFYTDPDYPKRLLHYPDCPVLLYKQGACDLNARRMLSIVGTRKPSGEGIRLCEAIIRDLQPFNPVIVSGLAYGIDITAHRQSLVTGLDTIAVMANGMGREYPSVHRGVARRIIEQGALLSEIPPGIMAEREFFPMRNRIIAGLCDGLLVVETAVKGGSMISADLANGYHKEVFAIPGRPGSTKSTGCNLLIKSHRARLVEEAKDIVEALGWEQDDTAQARQAGLFDDLEPEHQKLLGSLSRNRPVHIDELAAGTGWSISKLSAILLELECQGLLKNLPGNRYTLR